MVYIGLYIYIYLKALKFEFLKQQQNDFILYFILMFILGFAYQKGVDWTAYKVFYEKIIPNLNLADIFSSKFEVGYTLLNLLFYKMFNYEIFMGITLSICIYILIKNLKKQSYNSYVAIFLYLVLYLFTTTLEPVIRQLIALTIIITGLKYLEKNKFIKYLLTVIIAAQFHKAAYIFIFVYFIRKINFTLKKTILLFFFIFISIKNMEQIITCISIFIPSVEKYLYYFSNPRYSTVVARSIRGTISVYTKVFLYLYIIFYGYGIQKNRKIYIKNLAIIAVFIEALSNYLPILYRLTDYLSFFLVITLSYTGIMKGVNKKQLVFMKVRINSILMIFLLTINGIGFIRRMTSSELYKIKYIPYKNYFVEMIKAEKIEIEGYNIKSYYEKVKKIAYKKK